MERIYEEEESGISEQFIERMVDKVIESLGAKFDKMGIALGDIDVSIDFVASLLADADPASMAGLQRRQHRMASPNRGAGRPDDSDA
tara:strand:+ start:146 stop:406 length:261 start_codon:yes stop_codon:yes gene_type:complete